MSDQSGDGQKLENNDSVGSDTSAVIVAIIQVKFLHVGDNENLPGSDDPDYKLYKIDHFQKTFLQYYYPNIDLSTDETMVGYCSGRLLLVRNLSTLRAPLDTLGWCLLLHNRCQTLV